MFMQLQRKNSFFMILIPVFSVSLIMLTDDSFASHPKHRRVAVPPRIAHLGHVVPNLPPEHRRVWIGNVGFYVYGDVFYRRVPGGYAVVETPPDVIFEEESPTLVQPAVGAKGKVSVTASALNVRSGLMYPTIYQIHGKSDGWLYVLLPNGEYGWVMKEFTTLVEPPASG